MSDFPSSPHRSFRHGALLTTVSALALVLAAPQGASALQPGRTGSASSVTVNAATSAIVSAQQAAAATQQSMQSLTRAIQAMQAVQSAARAATAAGQATNVTDGLSAGGLVVDPRVAAGPASNLWVNAKLPTQATGNGRTTVTIQQTAQRAIMTWQQFNVGANTTLNFDQSAGNSANGNSWVALNRVDATGSPSQILGQIKAQGTVLLINPNGIIFTGTSQINVHTLIASAMDMNSFTGTGAFKASGDAYLPVLVNGLAQSTPGGTPILAPSDETNANNVFLNNGLFVNSGFQAIVNGSAVQTGNTALFSAGLIPGQGNIGIRVEAGASIATDVSGFDNGGFVALLGPQVANAGSIVTSAGQIILAAGSSVQIAEPAGTNTTQTGNVVRAGSSIAGALVYTPPGVSGVSLVLNDVNGMLVSRRGDITLNGDAVEQFGLAEATTSITRAGSITIAANGTGSGNQVLFGTQSLTAILPEENGETIPSDATSLATFTGPRIDVTAPYVDFQSGSWVLAPSATMAVTGPGLSYQQYSGPTPPPLGRVVLEAGSVIDLSGLTTTRSVSDYLYTFKVTANDVADTPLAQNLIGQTVTIDLTLTGTRADGETWVGSPLFASSGAGYLANITQGIDQLLTKGGSLNFGNGLSVVNGQATGSLVDVLLASGSVINISGGLIQFTGARITTTQVVGSDGRRYDIGSANPFIANSVASGFTVAHPHWGADVTETWSPLWRGSYYKPGYVDGLSAGSLAITAVNPILEGDLADEIVIGQHQRALAQIGTGANGTQATPDQLPSGGSLAITLLVPSGGFLSDAVVLAASAPDQSSGVTLNSPLVLPTSSDGQPLITYSTDRLSGYGLGSITISGADTISVAPGASLSVLDGGSIKLASVTTIDGTLTAHGGSISITGVPARPTSTLTTLPDLTLGAQAMLDVSGQWVNDTGFVRGITGALHINGGSVSLSAFNLSKGLSYNPTTQIVTAEDLSGSIVLQRGSIIDVSSGGYVGSTGKLAVGSDGLPEGKGGNLSLATYAGSWVGNVVDPSSLSPGTINYAPQTAANANVVVDGAIYAGGLSQGGSFALVVPEVVIDGQAAQVTSVVSGAQAGTVVLPTSFFTNSGFGSYKLTSTYGSTTVTAGTTLTLKQQNYRIPALAGLPGTGERARDFAALGYAPDGLRHAENLTLIHNTTSGLLDDRGSTAEVLVDQGAQIAGDPLANITLGGTTAMVLGSIVAPGGTIAITPQYAWIGADAVLDVSGTFVRDPRVTAYSTGTVLPGGSITLSGAAVVALAGSVFDISGASATIDVPAGRGIGGPGTIAQRMWSSGGNLALGGGYAYFGGTIRAAGGAPSAAGGTLTVTVGTTGGSIVVAQSGGDLAAAIAGQPTPVSLTALIASLLSTPGVQTTTSATSNAVVPAGLANFVLPNPPSAALMRGGEYVMLTAVDANGNTVTMVGTVGAYDPNSKNLQVNVLGSNGPGASTTYSNWTIAIAPATAFIAADTINTSGLDTVSFAGALAFRGNVNLNVAGSILISTATAATTLLPQGVFSPAGYSAPGCAPAGSCIPSIGGATVTLEAGYIRFSGDVAQGSPILPTLADGTLTLKGTQGIDLVGSPIVMNADTVNLVSDGDVRLTGTYNASSGIGATSDGFGGIPVAGGFLVADNLNITAREVYPTTGSAYLLMSLGLAPSGASGTHSTITFASNGAAPVTPLSAGGAIIVDANTIVQGGALYAPLGTIQLGFGAGQALPGLFTVFGSSNDPYDPVELGQSFGLFGHNITTVATDSVTLMAGSLTSVSANGLMIPYGTTTDGINWTSNNTILNGPPSKLLLLGGAKVETQTGAVIDGRGGGDVYAAEFVAGTGGSRNVLTTSAQTVYALVPGFNSALAASDPSFSTKVAAGQTVTIGAGAGIPAGTYTLLPAQYATIPGAYRVVVSSTNVNPQVKPFTTADGSVYMTGVFGNAINGTHSSQTALLQIQSNAVWTRYSEIDITKGAAYFTALAASNGTAVPRLAQDAARLIVAASTSLALNGTNQFAPAEGGLGGQLDITGTNLVVAGSDQLDNFGTMVNGTFTPNAAYAGYLFLDADMLSGLGIESTLIGGFRGNTTQGTLITATALNLEIATDAAHSLIGPELLFTSLAPTVASPGVHGLVVDAGSVITAQGKVLGNSSLALVFGADPVATTNASTGAITGWSTGVSGDGSLLRVSNGGLVDVIRHFVPGVYQVPSTTPAPTGPVSSVALGSLSIGAGAVLSGNTLTLDSSGNTTVPLSASLRAKNYDLSGAIINLGDGGSGGLVISAGLIGNFAGADNVRLRSASVFNVFGSNTFGNAANPIGTLTLDGAGLTSGGGATTITAGNIVFVNSQVRANTNGGNTSGSGGSLILNASNTLVFGAGVKTLSGFAGITGSAGTEVLFTGSGSLDAKAAGVSLTAPLFLVAAAASQALTTTEDLSLAQSGAAPALDPTIIGGALSLKGGSVDVSGTIAALGGTLTLEATTGALNLSGNALLTAAGTRISIGDLIQDTPAGSIRLFADAGDVKLNAGTTVDVSGAGSGYAGSLTIFAAGTATLGGTLNGAARYSDLGGKFALVAGQLNGGLPLGSGFTRSFSVSQGQGDITIAVDQTLTSEKVLLVANNGGIFIDGTIDASSASGGTIALYGAGTSTAAAGTAGASGVTIGANAKLYARYRAPDVNSPGYANGSALLVQRGGTITLGTTGTPDGTLNSAYGYQNVQGSGAITVASGAIFDVSGGAGGANIDNTGGSVIIHAPILTNNAINVSFNGTVVTSAKADGTASGDPLVVNAFAVWSTTDASTDPNQHFDGIIDPAGFFDATGTQIVMPDANGAYPTSTATAPASGAYLPHVNFYQTTLLNFVNNPFDTNAVAGSFGGAMLQVGTNAAVPMPPANLHLRPEIDLVNPTPATGPTSINNGNITVASNWNFGAGSVDSNANINLLYRTTNGGEPGTLLLRAANNVSINATISDGFFLPYLPPATDANSAYLLETASPIYAAYERMFGPNGLVYDIGTANSFTGGTSPTASPDLSFFNSAVPGFEYVTSSALFNSLQYHLQVQAPTIVSGDPRVVDQYNQFYMQYVSMFSAYASETVSVNTNSGIDPNIKEPGGHGSYIPYTDVVNYFVNTFSITPILPLAIPEAPSLANPYLYSNLSSGPQPKSGNDYVSLWENYFFSVIDGNLRTIGQLGIGPGSLDAALGSQPRSLSNVVGIEAPFCIACFAITPPSAPLPYTTLFEATYAKATVLPPPPPPPPNLIANNPATDSTRNIIFYNTTSSVNLMSAAASGKGSFSYDFVGGALFNANGASPVNPNAVVQLSSLSSTLTGNVTIDGHTSYINPLNNLTVDVPTLVRTGTGSITLTAAGDFALLDSTAPGAVYTAGYVADNAAGFTAPTLPTPPVSSGLLTTPVWATGGGNLIVTAGRDIIGIETPTDTGNQYSTDGSSAGVSTGEFWSAWYYVNGRSTGNAVAPFDPSAGGVQNSSWINYGTFFQGFGALGGGNIALVAGRNVKDVSASLPETIQYSGGQSAGGPAATAHYYGGGSLLVEAGNDVLSGAYYVGRGTGMIRAGGSVVGDATLFETFQGSSNFPALTGIGGGNPTEFSVPLLLAVQDGFIGVQASGSIDLGGIFQPTQIPGDLTRNLVPNSPHQSDAAGTLPSAIGASFDSYGPGSGVTLLSTSGSTSVNTLQQSDGSGNGLSDTLFTHVSGVNYIGGAEPNYVVASSLAATALTGDINLSHGGNNPVTLYASPISQLSLVAGGTIGPATSFAASDLVMNGGNDTPVLIYAGKDIQNGAYVLADPARVWAGRDIVNLTFTGQNNASDDITSIVAGRDILARRLASSPDSFETTTLNLYGPGNFVVEAGRNLGPFFSSNMSGGGGIFAIGDGSNSTNVQTPPKLFLPLQGANITLRYGVGNGTDYAAAIATYGDPTTTAAASGINIVPGVIPQIEQLVDRLIADRAKAAGISSPNVAVSLTPAEAADVFTALSSAAINDKLNAIAAKAGLSGLTFNLTPAQFVSLLQQQDALKLTIDRDLLAFLTQVNKDFDNPSSPYFKQYARAYQAISTLFPAALGYTDNSLGGTGATPRLSHTGDLRMARSLVETQTGGDIDLLGPGGNAFVGSNSADTLTPAQQGILTLQGGSIRSYTDGSVEVFQSRIFTEQGGNVELFSANGDLNAGKGPKSSAAFPPLELVCDSDGYCRVSPAGLVTGAGVGALLSVPGQDPELSNVVLTAPHGTVDAGAAGIRVAGNLSIVALQVLNAFNIQVGGSVTGLAVVQGPPVAALIPASNAAAATQQNVAPAQSNNDRPSVIIVEVLGYGGESGDAPDKSDEERRSKPQGPQTYNTNSPYQVLGVGALTDDQVAALAAEKRTSAGRP